VALNITTPNSNDVAGFFFFLYFPVSYDLYLHLRKKVVIYRQRVHCSTNSVYKSGSNYNQINN